MTTTTVKENELISTQVDRKMIIVADNQLYQLGGSTGYVNGLNSLKWSTESIIFVSQPGQHGGSAYVAQHNMGYKK